MVKTTVYLPETLKRLIAEVAAREGRSEADVIRTAVDEYARERARPRPRLPLFESNAPPDLAERDEEYLALGFGED